MSSGKTNLSSTQFAAKKLLGKAQTSNLKADINEAVPSNVSVTSEGVFGEQIPNMPGPSENFYTPCTGAAGIFVVERVELQVVARSDTIYDANVTDGGGDEASDSGAHGYELRLPINYESTSSNSKAGTGYFLDNQKIYESRGALQLIPPFVSNAASPTTFVNPYQLHLYYGDIDQADPTANEIGFVDNIDWQVDYYAGTIFIQDYSSTASKIPVSASAYIYVGKYLDESLSSAGGSVQILGTSSLGQATDITAVTKITFDASTGLNVTASTATEAIVSLGSHFSNIQVDGQDTLHATGSEDLEIEAGNGITLTTDKDSDPKKLTITSTGISFSRTEISAANDVLPAQPSIVGINATASLKVTLPVASGFTNGQYFTIKDEAGNANIYTITISASGADLIDGLGEIELQSPYGALNLYSNGTNKFFIY